MKTSGNTKGESMQNKTLSLLGALCLSTACFIQPVFAQNSEEAKDTKTESLEQKDNQTATSPEDAAKKQKEAAVDEMLGDNVAINPDKIVDFPGRPSLGSIEMATLPGINESIINGPTPMGESLSAKDMPSEQLLGRITTEVFQEMADLERGNVFLKLQTQKEELKNNLETLRAKYRQARLDEIAKREDVVRSRINWWQDQEKIRIEMERKKAETEAIEQQIAEAEELRNKLREEAIAEKKALAENPQLEQPVEQMTPTQPIVQEEPKETEKEEPKEIIQSANEIYSLLAVRGLKNNLMARIVNKKDGSVSMVKKGQKLKTGHKIIKIDRDTVQVSYAGRIEAIILAAPTNPEHIENTEETEETVE